MTANSPRSGQLSDHIHDLLHEYMSTHITTSHTTFTQLAVSELLSSLCIIPTHDRTSLTLPTDPFSALLALECESYIERFQTTHEALALIKRSLAAAPARIPSTEDGDADNGDLCKPMSPPILTRRAVRETPVLGKMTPSSLPSSYAELSKASLRVVEVLETTEPEVSMAQVLDVKFSLRATEQTAVRALLKSVAISTTPGPKRAHWQFHSPEPQETSPAPFVPIFSRRATTITKGTMNKDASMNLASMAELPGLLHPSVSHSNTEAPPLLKDLDLSEENMVVINGWQTYITSSPSLISDEVDDEDQLLFPSSPDTDVSHTGLLGLVEEIESTKIEEVQIPRARRIGGAEHKRDTKEVVKAIGERLGAFLVPLLKTQACAQPLGGPVAEFPLDDNTSVVGQPPSVTTSTADRGSEDGDAELRDLYAPKECGNLEIGTEQGIAVGRSRAYNLIRDEQLFEDDEASKCDENESRRKGEYETVKLMPVPILPAPDSGARKDKVKSLRDYMVIDNGGKNGASDGKVEARCIDELRFLKKTKGVASLRIALSWVPFTVSNPNDLTTDIEEQLFDKQELMQAEELLGKVLKFGDAKEGVPESGESGDVARRLWDPATSNESEDTEGLGWLGDAVSRCDIALTKYERGVRAEDLGSQEQDGGIKDVRSEEGDLIAEGTGTPEGIKKRKRPDDTIPSGSQAQSTKRARMLADEDSEVGESSIQTVGELLVKAVDVNDGINDSGIGMMTDGDDEMSGMWDDDLLDFEVEKQDGIGYESDEKENYPPPRIHRHTLARGGIVDWGIINTDMEISDVDDSGEDNLWRLTEGLTGRLDQGIGRIHATNTFSRQYFYAGESPLIEDDCIKPTMADDDDFRMGKDYDGDLYGSLGTADEPSYAGGSFEPLSLSFDSQSYRALSQSQDRRQNRSQPQESRQRSQDQNMQCQDHARSDWVAIGELGATGNDQELYENLLVQRGAQEYDKDQSLDAQSIPPNITNGNQSRLLSAAAADLIKLDMATQPLGIDSFTRLRAKTLKPSDTVTGPPPKSFSPVSDPVIPNQIHANDKGHRRTPQGLYDRKTLRLKASPNTLPSSSHRYMVSLDLLQKQGLVRSLRSSECLVDLVERHTLGGVDMIIDPHTCVIFAPLLPLPSQCEMLLARVTDQTWGGYKKMLVVFEGYPSSLSTKSAPPRLETELELYAYTPPIMKAIKKFRRDLDIAEACGTKNARCEVQYAFANTVGEAAAYTRLFGDKVQADDETGGMVWGGRMWLDLDASEEEADLASLGSMNFFSASIVLCQVTLQELLDLPPEERATMFGPLIGVDTVELLNADIERRLRSIDTLEGDFDACNSVHTFS